MSEVKSNRRSAGRWRVSSALPAAVLLAACSIGEGGIGLPVQRPGEAYPGVRQEVRGPLEVAANGCFELVIDERPWYVIWPSGSQRDDRVLLPNGQLVAEGATVVGIGAFTPTAPLVAKAATGRMRWGSVREETMRCSSSTPLESSDPPPPDL
jgi:hypothetical protein